MTPFRIVPNCRFVSPAKAREIRHVGPGPYDVVVASTVIAKRTRGPNKRVPWIRSSADGAAVLRLALDVGEPTQRGLVESIFDASFKVRRALQGAGRRRAVAFHAAPHERDRRGPEAVRQRLGLSREALERAAYAHLDRAPHLRHFTTKALVMHMADSVWTGLERHLFRDASGKRQGLPHVGRWFDFSRIPGRARSHTKPRKWETFRLHGTLEGHRAAYRSTSGKFFQPRRMRRVPVPQPGSWWTHDGPLVLVFSGLPGGELCLPVRLPAAPSNQAALDHYLADPSRWHKIDLVRSRDPGAEGGWRYEAHLMVLAQPYVSPATTARRAAAAENRSGVLGIDVNVSNVSVASHVNGADLRVTRIERDAGDRKVECERARTERQRSRRLDRSRRAANPEQYELSNRQIARQQEREARGLKPVKVIPRGPRKSRRDGKPLRAFRKDRLSQRYRRERAAQQAAAAASAQARRARARAVAGAIVLKHGFRGYVEDCNLSAWARLWGRSLAAFSPGVLLGALGREMTAVSRRANENPDALTRVPTATTALSQHCLCGARVPKTLSERIHTCPSCGLTGDRDAVSAVLASFIRISDGMASSATVDFAASRAAMSETTRAILENTIRTEARGRQDARTESNAHSARDGSSVEETGPTPDMAARRNAEDDPQATPNETGAARWTKSERLRETLGLPVDRGKRFPLLRDSS